MCRIKFGIVLACMGAAWQVDGPRCPSCSPCELRGRTSARANRNADHGEASRRLMVPIQALRSSQPRARRRRRAQAVGRLSSPSCWAMRSPGRPLAARRRFRPVPSSTRARPRGSIGAARHEDPVRLSEELGPRGGTPSQSRSPCSARRSTGRPSVARGHAASPRVWRVRVARFTVIAGSLAPARGSPAHSSQDVLFTRRARAAAWACARSHGDLAHTTPLATPAVSRTAPRSPAPWLPRTPRRGPT
jgi:hypothetical protein